MNSVIKKIPILRSIVRIFTQKNSLVFKNSKDYWISRYNSGGNSGPGSYNELAEYKADILNRFVSERNLEYVIEFGAGDGNQLKLAKYPNYLGFDISKKAVEHCKQLFISDPTKSFKLVSEYRNEKAELVLSLDVIYHLVEDEIFEDYMNKLFNSSTRFVIIYSSDTDDQMGNILAHVRHRKFTAWIAENKPEWKIIKHIPNKLRFNGDARIGSFADFYIFEYPDIPVAE